MAMPLLERWPVSTARPVAVQLRRIKFTIMDARSGDSLEPLGD
jgi:hypothetical protein